MRLLLSLQEESGAFESTVHIGAATLPDYNGFVTALVLRELGPLANSPGFQDARDRALDFLEQCESPFRSGFFAFWPRNRWPYWLPIVLDDADDTAVIASQLLHHGRIDSGRARRIASEALVPYRLENTAAGPEASWIRPGAFLTWLHHDCAPNPIDCVVNVNVVAFLSQIGFRDRPGYREACEMVMAGISWAARRWENLEVLSPYYPEPFELVAALDYALRSGASELRAAREELDRFPASDVPDSRMRVLFSIADRSFLWSSAAVWAARRVVREARLSQKLD